MATDPLVRDFVLPILRADIGAFEEYGTCEHGVLDIPVLAIGGISDGSISYSDLLAWSAHSAEPVAVKRVAGGHCFIGESGAQVAGDLREWLEGLGPQSAKPGRAAESWPRAEDSGR